MDAQNAVEATSTKPSASPQRQPSAPADPQPKATVTKSPTLSKSSPSTTKSAKPITAASHANDDDNGTNDGSSEAETIVLPGKDGHSPSKSRKVIKHEDKNDAGALADVPASRKPSTSKNVVAEKIDKVEKAEKGDKASGGKVVAAASGVPSRDQRVGSLDRDRGSALPGKKRRLHEKQRSKDGSSGLSSAPASPPHHRRRRLSHAQSDSGSEHTRNRSPKPSTASTKDAIPGKDKPRPLDKQLAHKRKAPKVESDEEGESRKARRRTNGDAASSTKENNHNNSSKPGKEPSRAPSMKSQHEGRTTSRTRSVSPQQQPRAHRRSISSQLPPHANGMSHKKKRIPAPLQSTDYPSDDSSANGSPYIRSSKLRSLTTPATAESHLSPAKQTMPHKKHLDAHGQTYLARACARGELEQAKQRLAERPEDLTQADYAGNTPLQIAAINGYHEIVQVLVDAGCPLDCVNNDKDTPLLDAVENGHLKVVKVLLNAGANPEKPNVSGEKPIERVDPDMPNFDEITAALRQATLRQAKARRPGQLRASEDRHDLDEDQDSHDPDHPRRSPGANSLSLAGSSRRGGTVRANKTSNHQLYMPMDDKTLRQAAAKGDEETVTRILQVRESFDDPESMVAAARGGHEMVMQLLLALGSANPDPAPVPSMAAEHATPMLAAIGQENIQVIRLLLDQSNFDPTRRFKGETYHEIAKRRQGMNWKEEEQMLKEAYDEYRKSHKDGKTKSPAKRDQDREARRANRDPKSESSGAHKRKASSPSREPKRTRAPTSPNEKRRSGSFSQQADQTSPKRGPGRPRKDDRIPNITISDREASPPTTKQAAKARKPDLDTALVSSDGETPKPRRKLVSGRDLKKESEKQRRASMASSSATAPAKEGSSPRDPRNDDVLEKPKSDKTLDRTKQLKRDESRDRASPGDSTSKKMRGSATPPHPGASEKDAAEGATKKRRLDSDSKDNKERKKQKVSASLDDRLPKASISREPSSSKSSHKDRDEDGLKVSKPKKREPSSDRVRRESGKSVSSEKSIHVQSEEPPDTEMPDAPDSHKERAEVDARVAKERDESKKKSEESESAAAEAKKKAEESKHLEAEEKEKQRKLAEEETKRKDLAAQKLKEEQEKKRQEEAEEKKRQEELERKRKEEEEKKRREEAEQQRREAEEKKRREEEEERKKREAAEVLRRAEAAEARRKQEEEQRKEDERKEQERKERVKREEERKEQERKDRIVREEERRRQAREAERAAREAEQREQEELRLAKLPRLLRWLDQCANPKTPELAELWKAIRGVRADSLFPELEGKAEGREHYVSNVHVALLLGEKDLSLSRFTAWNRVPASRLAKRTVLYWALDDWCLLSNKLQHLCPQVGYPTVTKLSYPERDQIREEDEEKFLALDLFFVKLSDLMFMIPSFPHLRNMKIQMWPKELPLDENHMFKYPLRWKKDPRPEHWGNFVPPAQVYVNGQFTSLFNAPFKSSTSRTPFPENPGPRRGLLAVARDDPDYDRLAIEQGLGHLVTGSSRPTSSGSGQTALSPTAPAPAALPKSAAPLVNGNHKGDAALKSELDKMED